MPNLTAPAVVDVHLVNTANVGLEDALQRWGSTLSKAENTRFQRYSHGGAALQFLVGRGLLRTVLGERIGCDPAEVILALQEHGKPFVAGPADGKRWQVSLSHTEGLVGVAIADGLEVGLDVQATAPQSDLAGVAAQVFTAKERHALADLGDATSGRWLHRFYTLWTAKEAWIKARGRGFTLPPRWITLSVAEWAPGSVEPEQSVTVDAIDPAAEDDAMGWRFSTWWPTPTHAATVATAGPHTVVFSEV